MKVVTPFCLWRSGEIRVADGLLQQCSHNRVHNLFSADRKHITHTQIAANAVVKILFSMFFENIWCSDTQIMIATRCSYWSVTIFWWTKAYNEVCTCIAESTSFWHPLLNEASQQYLLHGSCFGLHYIANVFMILSIIWHYYHVDNNY